MNNIIRPIGHNLGFDEYGQLWAVWDEPNGQSGTIVADLRGKSCAVCGCEFKVDPLVFRDVHYDQSFNEHVHERCLIGVLEGQETIMWKRLLCHPEKPESFLKFNWKKIPNEYGGAYKTAWYLVTFLDYLPKLKMGGRKRVYALSLLDLRREQVDKFNELFKDVESTKGTETYSVYAHAWDEAEAKSHLAKFYEIVRMDKPKADKTGGGLAVDLKPPIKASD